MKRLRTNQQKQVIGMLSRLDALFKLEYSPFHSNTYLFKEGQIAPATCLNCTDYPCSNYRNEEISTDFMEAMPRNPSPSVCPVNAIKINDDGRFPFIDQEACFGCGVCLSRCAYGAISINDDEMASVSREGHEYFLFSTENNEPDKLNSRGKAFRQTEVVVQESRIRKTFFDRFYAEFQEQNRRTNGLDNLLVRNLLANLGVKSKVRAIGNNDIRVDLLGQQGDKVIIGEVDLTGTDILNLPRSILDDIAVVHARHGIEKEKIVPILIIDRFPNKRSDFYEVLTDIKKVTGIEVKTLSLQFLVVLNLFRRNLTVENLDGSFFANKEQDTPGISDGCKKYFQGIEKIDPYFYSNFYSAAK